LFGGDAKLAKNFALWEFVNIGFLKFNIPGIKAIAVTFYFN